ncbi:hypothetical protein HanIR_Chr07g0310381 [Helianthus annuus]|nr:hypothetical protein HanIR_Chr07g0310381 [Helianthus annuus]
MLIFPNKHYPAPEDDDDDVVGGAVGKDVVLTGACVVGGDVGKDVVVLTGAGVVGGGDDDDDDGYTQEPVPVFEPDKVAIKGHN